MGDRGPTSEAELSAVAPVTDLPERPEPPPLFTLKEKATWWKITMGLPADHWRPSDLMLLEELCVITRLIQDCDTVLKETGQFIFSDRGNLSEHPAVMLRDRHVKTMVQIQKALRLCPSARVQKTDKGLGKTARKKPWEK